MRFNRSHFEALPQKSLVNNHKLIWLQTNMNLWSYIKGVIDVSEKVVQYGFVYSVYHENPVPNFAFIADDVAYNFALDGKVIIIGDEEKIRAGTLMFDSLI